MENVKKFYDALSTDEAMRERANALNKKGKPDEAETAAAIIAFAKAEGYDFTAEELMAYSSSAAREIPDDELGAIAGGVSAAGTDCFCVVGGGGNDDERGIFCMCVIGGYGKYDDGWGDVMACVFIG